MQRCPVCFAEKPEETAVCPECGFDGTVREKYKDALPLGSSLAERYTVGSAYSRANSFLVYHGFDTKTSERVRIYEYFHPKLMYRLPEESVVKFNDEGCLARGEKEIPVYYSHFTKLCKASEKTALDFTDCFLDNSTVYYVCSLSTGTPLSSVIGNGKAMPFSQAVNLIFPLFECISALGEENKWHGSITTYSVITNDNKITALTGYTYPPASFSSPFDAPEKQYGPKQCGQFTDIYAVGAMLYEAVTGFLPPTAEQRSRGRALKFPKGLDENEIRIIEKALASEKTERYSSIRELLDDIGTRDAVKLSKKSKAPKAPREKLPRKEIIRRTVFVIALITFIASLLFLLNYYFIEPYRSQQQGNNLASLVVTTDAAVDPWIAIREKYPDIDFPAGMNPEFAELYAANNDFAGWISIPELNIDFAVVQGDDNKYYERRDFYGESTNYGVPFFDYRNALMTLNRNTIIYGHNMRHDDKIFGTLEQYRDIEGFKKAPFITLDTLYAEYKFKVYAVFISNSKASDDNGHIFNYIFTNAGNSQFADYIAEIDKRKLYTTGVDINENDKIITLSTCCYDFEDARLVVVGRLVRDGEAVSIDKSLPAMNPEPKFPQAYYDKKGRDNPYKDDPDLFR